MKKIFIIVAFAMVCAGCSSPKLGEYNDRGKTQITIGLDRIDRRNYSAGNVIYRAQKRLKQLGYNSEVGSSNLSPLFFARAYIQ